MNQIKITRIHGRLQRVPLYEVEGIVGLRLVIDPHDRLEAGTTVALRRSAPSTK